MAKLDDRVRKLIEAKNFANIATLMPDGSPQITTVWVDHDSDTVIINTAIGRVKEKNMRRDARVALSIFDGANPYHAVFIRGTVESFAEGGAKEHIDKLAKKYMDVDKYPYMSPGEKRVIIRIRPEHITING